MNNLPSQKIFLLEFLLYNIQFNEKCPCDVGLRNTSVVVKLLDHEPMEISEEDFSRNKDCQGELDLESVKSGKSCIFSMNPKQLRACQKKFEIAASVLRKAPPGEEAERFEVGTAPIDITDIFADLIKCVRAAKVKEAMSRTLTSDFDIVHPTGVPLGKIAVFLRITCFGKFVVTQFESNFEKNSILFKDNDGRFLYRYQQFEEKPEKEKKSCRDKEKEERAKNCPCPKCMHKKCQDQFK